MDFLDYFSKLTFFEKTKFLKKIKSAITNRKFEKDFFILEYHRKILEKPQSRPGIPVLSSLPPLIFLMNHFASAGIMTFFILENLRKMSIFTWESAFFSSSNESTMSLPISWWEFQNIGKFFVFYITFGSHKRSLCAKELTSIPLLIFLMKHFANAGTQSRRHFHTPLID